MVDLFDSKEKQTATDASAPDLGVPADDKVSHEDLSDIDVREQIPIARAVKLKYDGYWVPHTTVKVTNTQQPETEVFTIKARYHQPQLTFHSLGADVATASWSQLGSTITITIHGREFKVESHKLGRRYTYSSPAIGQDMTWRPRKTDDLNMVLLNAQGLAIARYSPVYKTLKREGTLELLPESCGSDQMAEEVMVVGLAIVHFKEALRLALSGSNAY
jgi:hypothetical protein